MNTFDNKTNVSNQIAISNLLSETVQEEIISEIITGLTSDQKYISSKYFYDPTGSKLFEDITCLPDYYLTRTERSILQKVAPEITKGLNNFDLIELGSGDCSKISILIDSIPVEYHDSIRYVPVDVSHSAIRNSADNLSIRFPDIKVHGVIADFMSHLDLISRQSNRLICFFGSTLGNLTREQSMQFLLDLKENMQPGDQLLLGLDMVKNRTILERAYNDDQQITAAFNRNILNNVNRLLHTDFDLSCFDHLAFYNEEKSRIEMHLKASKNMVVTSQNLPGKISFKQGETIHTENSHKYTNEHIFNFSLLSGLKIKNIYSDINRWFSVVHFLY